MRIVSELEKLGDLSSNRFNEHMRNELKISSKTCRKYKNELLDEGLIFRLEDTRAGRVYYSADKSVRMVLAEDYERRMRERDKVIKEKLDLLKNSLASLSLVEQANLIAVYIRLRGLAKIDSNLVEILNPSERVGRQARKMDRKIKQMLKSLADNYMNSNISADEAKRQNVRLLYLVNDPRFRHDSVSFDSVVKIFLKPK